jgi:CHRD domain-containing protein
MKRIIVLAISALITAAIGAGAAAAAKPTPPGKSWVCHKAGPEKYVVIRVSTRAQLRGHMRHGDTAHATREAALTACANAVRVTPTRGGQKLEATLRAAPTATALGTGTFGSFTARVSAGQRRVCWTLTVNLTSSQLSTTGPVTELFAHIHGPRPTSSAIVVPLTLVAPATVATFNTTLQSGTATATGCETNVDREKILQILRDPGSYYVNVHTANFPGGAVEGTLSR